MNKTTAKKQIRAGLQRFGYGRGYTKDYIHCPKGADLETEVYNDLWFRTLDEVAEMCEDGDEVDAYVFSMSPVPWSDCGLIENVIIRVGENPTVNRTSRTGDPIPLDE